MGRRPANVSRLGRPQGRRKGRQIRKTTANKK